MRLAEKHIENLSSVAMLFFFSSPHSDTDTKVKPA